MQEDFEGVNFMVNILWDKTVPLPPPPLKRIPVHAFDTEQVQHFQCLRRVFWKKNIKEGELICCLGDERLR